MEKLPVELLSRIFVLLNQEDQLQCMLVCSLWNSIIEESCLFQTLHVYSLRFLDIILNKIQDKPCLSSNVEHLTLHSYSLDEPTCITFLDSLPNVKSFNYRGLTYVGDPAENKPTITWYKTIEEIRNVSNQGIVHHMLQNNLCPNLTLLEICFKNNKFIPLLKNTPALKSLTLIFTKLFIDDFNKIHETSPHLKTFKLKHGLIMGYNFDRDIKPASSVTEFVFDKTDLDGSSSELNMLKFIAQKYPNLTDLVYEFTSSTENDNDRETLRRVGFNPLIKNLALVLRKLHTSYTDKIQGFWETLDKHECQIHDLKIDSLSTANFANITTSQQSLFIRTLVISNIGIKSVTWLQEMKVLESLQIHIGEFGHLQLDFNDIIDNSPPTLTSLTLSNVSLTAKIISAKQSNIENLEFISTRLPKEIDRFIDRHFPLLNNLKFKDCERLMKKLTLRSVKLDSFCLIIEESQSDVHVLVRTLYDDQERLYSTRNEEYYRRYRSSFLKYDDVDIPPVKSRPAGLLKIKAHVSLCCYSVKKVILSR